MRGADDFEDDELLLTRLRDLSLVELDTLLAGSSGEAYRALLETYAEDLLDALEQARQRSAQLLGVARGGDPLALVHAAAEVRARDGGREAVGRVTRRLSERARACRALARLDDLTSQLMPRLFEADRRRIGSD